MPAGRGLAIVRRSRPTVAYLLRDLFRTPDAAPLTSPRTCEPGPGRLVATQSDGAWAIDGGALQFSAQTTPATGDLAIRAESSVGRALQRPVIFDFYMTEGSAWFGFWPSSTLNQSPANVVRMIQYLETIGISHAPAGDAGLAGFGVEMRARFMIQPVAAGGAFYFFHYPGFLSNWILAGFDRADTAANLYAGWANDTGVGTCQMVAIADETYVPTAVVDESTPAVNTNLSTSADCVVEARITLDGALVDGHKAEIRYRYQDAHNYWSLQLAVVDGQVMLGLEEVTEGQATLRSAETLPIGAGDTAYVQAMVGLGLCFCRWREEDASADIHSGPQYGDFESRGNDGVATMRLVKTGTPTIADLIVFPLANKEIPRAI